MEKVEGKVVKVFIPEEYINGQKIDVMLSDKIGFEVLIDNEVKEIILEQTEDNCNIFKNDMVYVIREKDELLDIELKDGENYE